MNRMKERYQKEIVPVLFNQLGVDNVMEVPAIKKVVVNIGKNVRGSYSRCIGQVSEPRSRSNRRFSR